MMCGEQCLEELGEAPGEKVGLLCQMHFVSWIVLGGDFMPLVRNIYIQFITHEFSFLSFFLEGPDTTNSVTILLRGIRLFIPL